MVRHPAPWVFCLALALYVGTMPGGITLEDAGFFQMACHLDGLAHPPGYPLFMLLCKPFVQLLFMDGVLAGNLLSAVIAAASVSVFSVIVGRIADTTTAWIAALSYAGSAAFWSQAIIIEVYTLAVLMFVVCWWQALRVVDDGRWRNWFLLAFLFGLSLSNHWPLMLLSTPALLAVLWPVKDQLFRNLTQPVFILVSMLCGILGLAPYLSILLNESPAIAMYGPVTNLSDLWAHVSRSVYADGQVYADAGDKVRFGQWLLKESGTQMGFWSGLFVIPGLFIAYRKLATQSFIAILLVYLGSTFLLLMLLNFEFSHHFQGIVRPYPVIAYLSLSVFFALTVNWLIEVLKGKGVSTGVSRLVATAMVFAVVASNLTANNRRYDEFADFYGRTLFALLPGNAVLFVTGDFESAPLGYLHHLENVRPDVEVRNWENLVFGNRLGAPFDASEQKNEEQARYISTVNRPVVSLSDNMSPSQHHGLFYLMGNQQPGESEELNAFTRYLVAVEQEKLLHNYADRELSYHLLMMLTSYYLTMAPGVSAEIVLAELQSTAPGKLRTVELLFENNRVDETNAGAIAAMLEAALTALPAHASTESLASAYFYRGELLRISGMPDQAMEAYRESVRIYPPKRNPAHQQLEGK